MLRYFLLAKCSTIEETKLFSKVEKCIEMHGFCNKNSRILAIKKQSCFKKCEKLTNCSAIFNNMPGCWRTKAIFNNMPGCWRTKAIFNNMPGCWRTKAILKKSKNLTKCATIDDANLVLKVEKFIKMLAYFRHTARLLRKQLVTSRSKTGSALDRPLCRFRPTRRLGRWWPVDHYPLQWLSGRVSPNEDAGSPSRWTAYRRTAAMMEYCRTQTSRCIGKGKI